VTRCAEVYLERGGATLFALDQGNGIPILFFHGGMADHRAALLRVGALADRLRVITPDLRGAGRSRWAGPLSWELLAADARALAGHLGLQRVVVGGISMGSGVALKVALDYPELVAGLVVVHPVYPGEDRGLAEPVRAAMSAMDEVGRRAPAQGLSVLYPLFDRLPEAIRARARAMLDSFDPGSVAATTRFLAGNSQPLSSAEELSAVQRPALVVPGTDLTHPAEVAELLAAHLPQAELVPAADEQVGEVIARFCLAR
jgi:pimeloyl-ACP methyl ester carboxylesterase